MTHTPTWDPGQYRRFATSRLRPALYLLRQVALTDPATVCDLGCGDGRVTWLMAERWARARLLGLDSSSEMLDDARGRAAEAAGLCGSGTRDEAARTNPAAVRILVLDPQLHILDPHLEPILNQTLVAAQEAQADLVAPANRQTAPEIVR